MTQQRDEATKKILETELHDLDETISAKSDYLAAIKVETKSAKIRKAQAERRYNEWAAKLQRLKDDYLKREKQIKSDLESLVTRYKGVERESEQNKLTLKEELDNVKSAIKSSTREAKERETYLREQEGIIQNTMDDGSARLADLDYQVKHLLTQQQNILQETAQLNESKDNLNVEVIDLAERKERMQELYDTNRDQYKATLTDLRLQIDTASTDRREQMAANKRMLDMLRSKEQELTLREESLESREVKNAEERRFIESRKYLQGQQ